MLHDMSRPPTPGELAHILRNPDFSTWMLKEYKLWQLFLNGKDQGLPGRAYAWCRRHIDRMSPADMTPAELLELHLKVIPEYEQAVRRLVPTVVTFDYEWLGNETQHHRGHGHLHMTPRFDGKFQYVGRNIVDDNPQGRRTAPKHKPSAIEWKLTFNALKENLS